MVANIGEPPLSRNSEQYGTLVMGSGHKKPGTADLFHTKSQTLKLLKMGYVL